ncbi:U1 zinc finger domain-containing protein [Cryptosporidium muris RN66]|uniref:U1 zinc finger domain-containing protein n=1 Tax=Cryptosporidium muris (strain RN66) TaxID=441375 RepID=B6AAJ4_CRYMR|nr:U1 zinc finger domain-containing protein [Cryptosporidium muris RN66]EEA05235.1 U1 zinc finger domain-containing protein [Cryptosporidium muris RN66]|eukprot:XP_002139584.1 U1 zinc finger domain-containing protein [Cryptosporidium muris RN66]
MIENKISNNRYYCNICKIWIANHPVNIRHHEDGIRHKRNQQKLLRNEKYKAKQDRIKDYMIQEELKKMENPNYISKSDIKQTTSLSPNLLKIWTNKSEDPFIKNNINEQMNDATSCRAKRKFEGYKDTIPTKRNSFLSNKAIDDINKSSTSIGKWEEVTPGESIYKSITEETYSDVEVQYKELDSDLRLFSKEPELDNKIYDINIAIPPVGIETEDTKREDKYIINEPIKIRFKKKDVSNKVFIA